MKNLKISVIIPIYNGALLINRCLGSIFKQHGNYDLEVIVIDDGSTDNSKETVSNYPKPILLLEQTNQGPAAARNKGIQVATGNYIAFLDADDYWEASFLKETVPFLEKYNQAIAVSVGQKHNIFGKESSIVPGFLSSESETIEQARVLDNFFDFWAEHFHICTGSILMRTEIVRQTEGQRTDLRITEDLEFWAYLATFGPIGFIPQVLFISDGIQVTKQIGWIKKNKKRWASAPTVQHWEKRILNRITKKNLDSYYKARGRIAKNLCYSMIMSGRNRLAYRMGQKYGHSFPPDKVGKLLQIGAKNVFFWMLIVLIIYIKEYTRIIYIKQINL